MRPKRREWRRSSARLRKRNQSFLQKVLLLLLGVVAFYFFLHSPVFALKSIQVKGNHLIPENEIIDLAAVHLGANIFQVKVSPIEEGIRLNPMVEKVEIHRRLPSTLVVAVTERVPKALLPISEGFMVVDAQGVYLRSLETVVKGLMPIVTGVTIPEGIGPGQGIEDQKLMVALGLIDELEPNFLLQLAEIHVGDPRKILFYTNEGVEVRFGDGAQAGEKSRLIQAILAQTTKDQNLEYIDVSSVATPVFK